MLARQSYATLVVSIWIASWVPACSAPKDTPLTTLKQNAECMLDVLKTIPGVGAPRLGYSASDGWLHPFLEYVPSERARWVQPTRFEARKPIKGTIYFQAIVPGLLGPEEAELDLHVTDTVVKKWKDVCGVDAVVISV